MGSTWFTSMALPFRKQISVLGGKLVGLAPRMCLLVQSNLLYSSHGGFAKEKSFFLDDATFDVFLEIPAVVFLLTLCQYRIYKAQ